MISHNTIATEIKPFFLMNSFRTSVDASQSKHHQNKLCKFCFVFLIFCYGNRLKSEIVTQANLFEANTESDS